MSLLMGHAKMQIRRCLLVAAMAARTANVIQQVGEGHNSDRPSVVDDDQTANRPTTHHVGRAVDRTLRIDRHDVRRHEVGDQQPLRLVAATSGSPQITGRKDPDRFGAFFHQQVMDPPGPHAVAAATRMLDLCL